MAKSGNKNPSEEEKVRIIARNRKALHDYKVLSQLECGLVLQGSEVKSLRSNQANISDSFARIEKGEIWLYGMDIPEYTEANQLNHKAKRRRKMLLNRSEIRKVVFQKGKSQDFPCFGIGPKVS